MRVSHDDEMIIKNSRGTPLIAQIERGESETRSMRIRSSDVSRGALAVRYLNSSANRFFSVKKEKAIRVHLSSL